MKKTLRLMITLLLTLTLLASFAISAFAAENEFDFFKNEDADFEEWKSMIEDQQEEMDEEFDRIDRQHKKTRDRMDSFFSFFWVFFAVILCLVVYILVTLFHLSSKSMDTRVLPSRKRTVNTVTVGAQDKKVCTHCGRPFGEEAFCPTCGTPKKTQNVFTVPINKRMTAQKFEKYINDWLAENPYIYNCKFHLDTRNSLFSPFVQYKFFIKSAAIEYSVSDKPVPFQYGYAFLYRFRLFGPIGYSEEKHVAQWNQNNPNCHIISHKGGRIQHFSSDGGFNAEYYNHVFYYKNC